MEGNKTTGENLRAALSQSVAMNRRRDSPDYKRNLTDDDVEAIVTVLQKRVTEQFYQDVGKGVWAMAWKGLLLILAGLGAYGYFGGHMPK